MGWAVSVSVCGPFCVGGGAAQTHSASPPNRPATAPHTGARTHTPNHKQGPPPPTTTTTHTHVDDPYLPGRAAPQSPPRPPPPSPRGGSRPAPAPTWVDGGRAAARVGVGWGWAGWAWWGWWCVKRESGHVGRLQISGPTPDGKDPRVGVGPIHMVKPPPDGRRRLIWQGLPPPLQDRGAAKFRAICVQTGPAAGVDTWWAWHVGVGDDLAWRLGLG